MIISCLITHSTGPNLFVAPGVFFLNFGEHRYGTYGKALNGQDLAPTRTFFFFGTKKITFHPNISTTDIFPDDWTNIPKQNSCLPGHWHQENHFCPKSTEQTVRPNMECVRSSSWGVGKMKESPYLWSREVKSREFADSLPKAKKSSNKNEFCSSAAWNENDSLPSLLKHRRMISEKKQNDAVALLFFSKQEKSVFFVLASRSVLLESLDQFGWQLCWLWLYSLSFISESCCRCKWMHQNAHWRKWIAQQLLPRVSELEKNVRMQMRMTVRVRVPIDLCSHWLGVFACRQKGGGVFGFEAVAPQLLCVINAAPSLTQGPPEQLRVSLQKIDRFARITTTYEAWQCHSSATRPLYFWERWEGTLKQKHNGNLQEQALFPAGNKLFFQNHAEYKPNLPRHFQHLC